MRCGYTKCFGEYKLECSWENLGLPMMWIEDRWSNKDGGGQGMSSIVAVAEAVEVEDN
jgi:hypothetical protein